MRVKFREAGFTPDEIELHIKNFSDRYEGRTDEEIEADMMRRGGPSKVVARVIEQRNSILMKDDEYRAFVEGQDTLQTDAPAEAAAPTETQSEPAADDPLRAWFSDSAAADTDTEAQADALASIFRDDHKTAASVDRTSPNTPPMFSSAYGGETVGKDEDEDADIKIMPPRTGTEKKPVQEQLQPQAPTLSAVHTIPLFEDPPTPKPQNLPPRRTAVQPVETDGHTKIIGIAAEEPRPRPQDPQVSGGAAGAQKQDPFFAPQPVTDSHRDASVSVNRNPHSGYTAPETKRVPGGKKQRPAFLRLSEITYWGEGSLEGVRRFRLIFGLSLPFVILLVIVLTVLLLGLTAVIAAAVIALIVALVVEVALGSIVALVGIIYGISQLFLVTPIGMFELGLGIAAVGITMLCGILIYNLAVRFFPFILRQMYRFAGFFRHYLVDLYYYVKGECYRR